MVEIGWKEMKGNVSYAPTLMILKMSTVSWYRVMYIILRVKYLPSYLYMNPSVHKFVKIFNTCNKNNMLRMSKYIKEATERYYYK